MTDQILAFLRELDAALQEIAPDGERLEMYHLGRSALVLYHHYPGGTGDVDILGLGGSLEQQALQRFGKGTARALELQLYLETVPVTVPPVPHTFRPRCQEVPGPWKVIRLWRPDPHDLAATKLKSFRPRDREDLTFLCDHGLLTPGGLRASLESAFLWTTD
jgi:hypothetical protein